MVLMRKPALARACKQGLFNYYRTQIEIWILQVEPVIKRNKPKLGFGSLHAIFYVSLMYK